jgi:hypothetical protein
VLPSLYGQIFPHSNVYIQTDLLFSVVLPARFVDLQIYEYPSSRSMCLNHGYCGLNHMQLFMYSFGISYPDIRGLCGSNVHTRVFCRSPKALHSRPLPLVSHAHTVNISLHYFTTYFHHNSVTRSTVQTQPSLSNPRPFG